MSYVWNFKVLYSDKANNFSIVRADSTEGQVFANKYGVFGECVDGLQWISSDSEVNLLNGEGMFDHTVLPYEKMGFVNAENYKNPVGMFVSVKPSSYFCISDPAHEVCWDGDIYQLASSETAVLTNVQGQRIYVAEGEVTVNGTALKTRKVAYLKDSSEVEIVASEDSVVALFYPVIPDVG